MKNPSIYAQIELEEKDRLMVTKEGTMIYLRVYDNLGVLPTFRADIRCQSDLHAEQMMEGIRGKSTA